MRRLFDRMLERYLAFLAQRADVLLLVQCADEHLLAPLKQIESIAEASPDVIVLFAEVFRDASSYATSICTTFRGRRESIDARLAKSGRPPWPPLPPACDDPTVDPVERVRALMTYVRDRIPDLSVSNAVFALLPGQVADPLAFRLFLRRLIRFDPLAPWCHHVRIIAREPRNVSSASLSMPLRHELALEAFESTQTLVVDLSPAATNAALREEIDDPNAPLPDRARSLFLEANLDTAHRRHSEALEKLASLIPYYQSTDGQMWAACLQARAEAVRGVAGFARARGDFELAMDAAIAAQSLPVLLNVCLSLASGHVEAREWDVAAGYFEAGDAAAGTLSNAETKLRCLEMLGVCHYEAERFGEAQQAWLNGRQLGWAVDAKAGLVRILGRLSGLYRMARMPAELAVIEREIAGLS